MNLFFFSLQAQLQLNELLIDLEDGKVAMRPVSKFYLALIGNNNAQLALLRSKLQHMTNRLEPLIVKWFAEAK